MIDETSFTLSAHRGRFDTFNSKNDARNGSGSDFADMLKVGAESKTSDRRGDGAAVQEHLGAMAHSSSARVNTSKPDRGGIRLDIPTAGGRLEGRVFTYGAEAVHRLSYLNAASTESLLTHEEGPVFEPAKDMLPSVANGGVQAVNRMGEGNVLRLPEAIVGAELSRCMADPVTNNSIVASAPVLKPRKHYQKQHVSVSSSENGSYLYVRDSSGTNDISSVTEIINAMIEHAPEFGRTVYYNGNKIR